MEYESWEKVLLGWSLVTNRFGCFFPLPFCSYLYRPMLWMQSFLHIPLIPCGRSWQSSRHSCKKLLYALLSRGKASFWLKIIDKNPLIPKKYFDYHFVYYYHVCAFLKHWGLWFHYIQLSTNIIDFEMSTKNICNNCLYWNRYNNIILIIILLIGKSQ